MRGLAVVLVCLFACSRRAAVTSDGKPHPGDAAPIDVLSRVDAPEVDAVSYLDAPTTDAAAYLDASHADAALHLDAAHPDAAVHVDAAPPDATAHVDAGHPDAAHPDAAPDAWTTSPNTVTCFTEGNPAQTCTLPVHCCFSNYSSYHDGQCSTGTCLYGTISCDGPEDCQSGQHCCSHALFASDGSVDGYSMACQATACGAAPANYELCHPTGPACSNGGTCVTAYLNDNDLPRTLYICQ